MDQVFVCTQCGEESDAPGSCQICGLALVPMQDDDGTDDDLNTLGDDVLEDDGEEDALDEVSLEEEQEEEAEDDAYDSFDDEDNA